MGNILAIEKDGIVYLATDTVKEIDSMNMYHKSPENIRIKALPNGVIIGCLGNARATQQIFAHPEWFDAEVIDKKYLVTKVVPQIYEELKEIEEWRCEKYAAESTCSVMAIIAKGSDYYIITQDLIVKKCKGYSAISYNSGDVMITAYLNSSSEQDVKNQIINAFKAGTNYNDSFFTEIAVINTKDKKLEIIEVL